jgi:MFS family permease
MISKGTSDTSRISRRALLAISYIVLISRYINATSLSAFFSPLATQWRISPTFNGAIFAAYPFGMALASFFAPRGIAAVGTRTVITGGLLLGSLLTVAFGVTPDVVSSSSPEQLGTLFMVTYFLNGLFGALAETACIILLTTRFQDRLGAVMAGVGSVCGIGCMVGPLVGGLMFDMTPAAWGAEWRFRMPFLITALFGVLLALSIHRWLPNQRLGVDGPSGGCVSSASLFLAVRGARCMHHLPEYLCDCVPDRIRLSPSSGALAFRHTQPDGGRTLRHRGGHARPDPAVPALWPSLPLLRWLSRLRDCLCNRL